MGEEMTQAKYMDEDRLWKTLDDISLRLGNIESELSEVVRLEERVGFHHETLKRYGDRLDKHGERIRKVENLQSESKGKSGVSSKVIALVAGAVSATTTGVITGVLLIFFKGP